MSRFGCQPGRAPRTSAHCPGRLRDGPPRASNPGVIFVFRNSDPDWNGCDSAWGRIEMWHQWRRKGALKEGKCNAYLLAKTRTRALLPSWGSSSPDIQRTGFRDQRWRGGCARESRLGAQIRIGLARGGKNFTRPGGCGQAAESLSLTLSLCPTLAPRGSETVSWESGSEMGSGSVGVLLFPASDCE